MIIAITVYYRKACDTAVTKMEKLAQIKWGRGKFSEVFRSTIINPSPIKPGQKVQVIWGETKKEYTAVVECYPVEQSVVRPEEVETEMPQRRARTKRKLVSKDFTFYHSRFIKVFLNFH